MTRNPDGAELLAVARELLLRELLPLLPQEKKLDTLMIANAMGVAAREITSGGANFDMELESLSGLLDKERDPAVESAAETSERLHWLLASEIRSGKRDGSLATFRVLKSSALARLSESNPKLLNRVD